MEPTTGQIMDEVLRINAQLTEARANQLIADKLSRAIADGIRTAVSDPELWSAAIMAVQQRARNQAGGWLFGGVKAAMSKVLWLLVIGLGVYLLGGWAALVALFKAQA